MTKEVEPVAGVSLKSIAALISGNLAILAALLYLIGWVYLYSLLDAFGVSLVQLGVSWTDAIIHSSTVLRQAIGGRWIIASAGIAILTAFTAGVLVENRRGSEDSTDQLAPSADSGWPLLRVAIQVRSAFAGCPKWLLWLASLLLCLATLHVIVETSRRVGLSRANQLRVLTGDHVVVHLKENCTSIRGADGNWKGSQKLKRLYATEKWQIFYAQTGGWSADGKVIQFVSVVQIPADCIAAVSGDVRPRVR